ncbi:MAG: discoidin domain-containing protein [Mucilaginibacter sp.]
MITNLIRSTLLILIIFFAASLRAQQHTRGIGIYPGDPKENFGPAMKIDAIHYRNLALNKAVYQSGAYDYNLTGQLITDGIVTKELPGWIVTSTSSQGILPRDGREHLLDRHASSQQQLEGSNVWVQFQMAGNYNVPPVDSLSFIGSLTADTLTVKPWAITVKGSDDGAKWDELGKVTGNGNSLPGSEPPARFRLPAGQKFTPEQMVFFRRFAKLKRRSLNYGFKLNRQVNYKYYRLSMDYPDAKNWSINDVYLSDQGKTAPVGGPYNFTSAWKSEGNGIEWVYVDMGAQCSFNRIKLNWISPALQGAIQSSTDANHWQDIASLTSNTSNSTEIKLDKNTRGRYVRVLMTKPANPENGYILSELEVMGTGGPVPVAHALAGAEPDSKFNLAGGAWKLQRASQVKAGGAALSAAGFNDKKWLIATVPATTLASYLNDGALPEPNYDDNNLAISDSYFYDDFWYRDEFTSPIAYKGKHVYLNFDGINWEAEIYLNGHSIGRIDGAFIRGKFDITNMLSPGGKNILAVRVIKNETPGFPTEQNRNSTDAHGGELGADNPTFHASIGWDWIPTIRGRNTGIWNNVYLSASGPVTIENPLVTSKLHLPDTTSADISMQVTLNNYSAQKVKGLIRGKFGNMAFDQAVTLNADETKTITLDPSTNPVLHLQKPQLWWPNGYGKPNLYNVSLAFVTADGKTSDTKTFKTGIREMTYSDSGNLKLWVNGKRFIPRGGNMGFSEDLLRYRSREYDIAVRYHKEMNFNMIRNWVGQVGDDAFFEACDKYGIMIWQDFWLANPSDGPVPNHPDMFNNNLTDFVKRIRNHPSIGLYVGRNEGNPPPAIQQFIDANLSTLAPGIRYIPNSASYTVSGGGPYALQPLKLYFQNRATPKFHSEMGMPDLMSYESFKLTMPDSAIWPQSRSWGVHDFTLQGAQRGETFNKTIEQAFGKIDNGKKWLSIGAWMEYQGYRAMFEAQSKNRMGLLIWMSHPSWPTLVWQTYDYYFESTAAYFGAKKASEPLHIQWNPLTDSVEVVNYSIPNANALSVKLQVLDMEGKVKLTKQVAVNSPIDSRTEVMPVTIPTDVTGIYMVRLELSSGNELISRNEYCRGAMPDSSGGVGNLRAITQFPAIKLTSQTQTVKAGDHWLITTKLTNNTKYPAFNIRLKVTGNKSGERILPVIYSDNYFTMLPGDERIVTITIKNEDARGEQPKVVIEGFNVK